MRPPVLLLAVWVLLLAGCVSPPSNGPVQPGLQGPVPAPQDPLVRPIANPPRTDMSVQEVVAGFLDAVAAVGDDYRVAREYLTQEAASTWDPGAGVTVMAADTPQLTSAGTTVTASYTQVAQVSASGVLRKQSSAAGTATFPMATVDGQWRIAAPPPGLLLSRIDLDRGYEERSAYFIDPSGSLAVPDVRLLPRTQSEALATALVNALLAGPSQWLAPAVASAVPDGLQLALGAVPVTDGVARVELSGPAVNLDEAALQQFGAQFAWTLRQVPGLTAFDVSVSGVPLRIGEGRGPVELARFDSFDPDIIAGTAHLYGITPQGGLARVDDGAARAITSDAAPAASIAVSPAGSMFAAAAADRGSLMLGRMRAGAEVTQTIPGQIADGPSIDARDRVWWTGPDGQVLMAQPDENGQYVAVGVPVAGLPGPVRAVRPSRDGTRALVLADTGAGAASYAGVVVQAEQVLRIEGLVPLGAAVGATSVAWHNAQEVTVALPNDEVVERYNLLGSMIAAFAVVDTTRTVADAPQDVVVIGLADGSAGPLTGSGVRILDGLTMPAYPG